MTPFAPGVMVTSPSSPCEALGNGKFQDIFRAAVTSGLRTIAESAVNRFPLLLRHEHQIYGVACAGAVNCEQRGEKRCFRTFLIYRRRGS